jgi:hypothetical protein
LYTFQNYISYEKEIYYLISSINNKKKTDHLKFRKKTRESTFSYCSLVSRIHPVLLNTLLLAADDAGIERSGGAKRDNFGKIDECFFHHYVVADIDFEYLLNTTCSIFLLIFSFFPLMIIHITN